MTFETPSDSLDEIAPDVELRQLVGALRSHLAWLAGRGPGYVLGAASPRRGWVEEPLSVAPGAGETPGDVGVAGGSGCSLGTMPEGLGPLGSGAAGLDRILEALGDCSRCGLHHRRIQIVFGQGNPDADLMFVGEAPGRDEDLVGEAFVGAAGALLTKMIKAMGLARESVYIANLVKCRPPDNRNPEPTEIATCVGYLGAQIRAIQPRIIVSLGRFAAQTLLQSDDAISRLRGRMHPLVLDGREMLLMPTYHPAYLLRNPEAKRPVWEDLKQVMSWMTAQGLLTPP